MVLLVDRINHRIPGRRISPEVKAQHSKFLCTTPAQLPLSCKCVRCCLAPMPEQLGPCFNGSAVVVRCSHSSEWQRLVLWMEATMIRSRNWSHEPPLDVVWLLAVGLLLVARSF
eukprot:TRINITY_DN12421_c1_g8_i2.p1 TRINITY_DN12421_c1_g8~~TRINITY_DN12421_c1_g8_i2.p1  ORF type:complete len:114 (-),score=2.33 TRINITY_DN12421_c1_g8_i2:114-455(-)